MKADNKKRFIVSEGNENKIKKRKQSVEFETENSSTSKSNLYKPPTVEELNQLRETEILFNSNLFRLQTEELVKEVSIKEKRRREINVWIEKLENFLNNLPEYDSARLSNFNTCLEQVKPVKRKGIYKKIFENNPLHIKTDQDAPIKFLTPLNVQTVGLYSLNASIGPTIHITLNITIPKTFFQEKDYLNARYIVKRSLYLSYIGTHLKENQLFNTCRVSFTYLNGNQIQPILQLEPHDIKNVAFDVMGTPEEGTFKMLRFQSDKSNVRWSYWKQIMQEKCDEDEQNDNVATKWYNAVLAHDVGLNTRNAEALEALQELGGTCDALRLLSVWLRQRHLQLNETLLIALATHLVHTARLNRHMSSYQAVRALFTHLANNEQPLDDTLVVLLPAYDATLQHIRYEAKRALQLLDIADLSAFHTLFMTPMPPYLQYDALVNIYQTSELDDMYDALPDSNKLEFLTYKYPVLVNHIVDTLRTGLTDRVLSIVPLIVPHSNETKLFISLGILLNTDNMLRVVDKGPPAYDPESAAFRNFWGDKAELRRFKDGTICEAVYWPAEYMRDKRRIPKQIIQFVLQDKLKINNYNIVYNYIDDIVDRETAIEEGNLFVVTEFDALAKRLRELQLPLSIASVAGIAAAFSHSDVQPPTPTVQNTQTSSTYTWQDLALLKDKQTLTTVPHYAEPVEAVIQMVQHSKWPSELGAMRALRGALFLQMSRELKRSGVTARASYDSLDVMYADGLVARLDLFHPRELSLLPGPEAEAREVRCVLLPRVRGALAGVRARCPALPLAAALASRWVRAQLLQLPPATAELLVAAACGEQPVALPQRAFLLFLDLMARHSWAVQPLFYGDLTAAQRDQVDQEFRAQRETFPPLCVVTPWDLRSRLSQAGPSEPHLQRLRLLAKRALNLIEQQILSQNLDSSVLASLFKPNLQGYHVLIHLHPQLNARRRETLTITETTDNDPIMDSNQKMPIVNFNPVQIYLDQLRENYDDYAVFFHDIHGGNVIAVLWKPNIMETQEFKVSQVAGMKLLTTEQKLQVNTDAIIEDFYILGEGLVQNIDVL